jgi:hypothetical protein
MTGLTAASVVRLFSAVGLVTAIAATAAAQGGSLGDLAKQEAARRKAVKSSGKVLTNDSVTTIRSSSPASTSSAAPAPAASGSAAPTVQADAKKPEDKPKPDVDRKAQEAAWRQRIEGARAALQRSQMFADALQSQINGLTTDFTSRDDPAQRAVIADNRQKALAELDRVKNEIAQQTKAISEIQEEARRAGVPPGWLR